MKILVTGAKGFVGKNLCAQLNNIKDGKARCYGDVTVEAVYEYDLDSTPEQLDEYCKNADFVFNLAGVNRPQNQEEFMQGNFGFASTLLDTLKAHGNRCPVMLSSSQQASLTGRFGNSEYGRSKKAGEDLFLRYEQEFLRSEEEFKEFKEFEKFNGLSGSSSSSCETLKQPEALKPLNSEALKPRVLIYRFPNLFGKWCRPNYNSAVATFCNNIANDLPITVNDPSVELELLYIDDLVDEMIACLLGKEHRCEFEGLEVIPTSKDTEGTDKDFSDSQILDRKIGRYCYCPITHKVTLGTIVDLLHQFSANNTPLTPFQEISLPPMGGVGEGPLFAKKLYSTFLSYLPKEKVAFPLKMNVDDRGSFTELVHTLNSGQVSINISKPGITKGQHWHNTKWEFFIVVAGHGLIQERKLGTDEVIEFEVSGDNIQAVHMLPGYTHNIINLSDTENLVTVMYANELFDPNHPDTFFEKV